MTCPGVLVLDIALAPSVLAVLPMPVTPAIPAASSASPARQAQGTVDIPAAGLTLHADIRAIPSGPVVAILLFSLTTLAVLALHPASDFHGWLLDGCRDLRELFRPLAGRRHVIHDRRYLAGILEQEFRSRAAHASSSSRDSRRADDAGSATSISAPPHKIPDPSHPSSGVAAGPAEGGRTATAPPPPSVRP